jgi:hypothetical protein
LSKEEYGNIAQLHVLTEPDYVLRFQRASDVTFIDKYLIYDQITSKLAHQKQIGYQTPALEENKLNTFILNKTLISVS